MTTVAITEITAPDALHARFAGEVASQPAQITLDLRDGTLGAEIVYDTTGHTPAVHYGLIRTYRIPALTADAANRILGLVAPLAQRVLDGSKTGLGRNGEQFGDLNADADAAEAEIAALTKDDGDWAEDDLVQVWSAGDWFADADPAREFGITADTTDERLAEIAESILADAQDYGVIVIYDLDAYVANLREESAESADN